MFHRFRIFLSRFFGSQMFITLIILFLLVLISAPVIKLFLKNYRLENEIKTISQSINDLEYNNFQLKEMIKYIQSVDYAEEQARLNFNLKKAGESVAVIVGASSTANNENLGNNIATTTLNTSEFLPAKWFNYFFNKKK